jgi:hypothetical protein
MDVLSAFRRCGRGMEEFFKSTRWALYGQMKAGGPRLSDS